MQKKLKRIIPGLLASMTLVACASQTSAQNLNSQTASSSQSTNIVSQTSSQSSDYFSDSDLIADYDESSATKISLEGSTAQIQGPGATVSGSKVTISSGGTYIISGSSQGLQILVQAGEADQVQLVLDGVEMTGTDALIAVTEADKVMVTTAAGSENSLEDSADRTATDYSAAIYSKKDITFNGSGHLTVTGNYNNAIKGNDEVKFTGGDYTITSTVKHAISANDALNITDSNLTLEAAEDGLHSDNDEDANLGNLYIQSGTINISSGDDAIHASKDLVIEDGNITITESVEGLEGKTITVNGGAINLAASDDGVNATDWTASSNEVAQAGVAITINGGDLTIAMAEGDTDAIDSNGDLTITGGSVTITGPYAFDFNGNAQYTGGNILVNGKETTSIEHSMMGGPGSRGSGR